MTDEQFLVDLEAVYRKHGLIVGACGCCDSPFLDERDGDGIDLAIKQLRPYVPPEEARDE